MMATHPASPSLHAANRSRRSTRKSSVPRMKPDTAPARFRRHPASFSRPSADLAGRSVGLSRDIPTIFDQPLAAHHKLIGQWAISHEKSAGTCTRPEARRRIERIFDAAVLEILCPIEIVDFRIAVLHGRDVGPPAIAVICDSIGQLDLGWIETSEAPMPWRAAAYRALEQTLGIALPVFGYDDLFEEISMYYWEGETDDEAARECLLSHHGVDPADLDEISLPSTMNARRPEWMIGANAAQAGRLPKHLREMLDRLNKAHGALRDLGCDGNAWHFDRDLISDYLPDTAECAILPPMTLVPFDQFARELDDVGRHGMEMGFMDVAGICQLPDAGPIDDWLASLRLGADLLIAAQELIQIDPIRLRGSHGKS